ncbi:MAG: amidohydrolase family protein [Opitutae bacterium]
MLLIDSHVHLYPPDVNQNPAAWAADQGESAWGTLCTRKRKNGSDVQGFPSVDELLRALDAAGVDRAVLLGWYWQHQATCVRQNRFYAACIRAHPDRLAAFATVQPTAGAAALAEMVWAQEQGFRGLGELSPHAQQVAAGDSRWGAVLGLAGQLKLPVNLHVTDPSSRDFPGRVLTPLGDFIRWSREFPSTKFILAHWGGGLAFDSESRPLRNVWYDSAASPLLYGPEVWTRAAKAVGVEKILFGSDYPLVLYPQIETTPGIAGLRAEAYAADAGEGVLGGNASKLLNW